MAMRRAVDQLGPMALAIVSLAIIIGIGAVVLGEIASIDVISNSTTAQSTVEAGQQALGTFGDFFTVIVVDQPTATQVSNDLDMKNHYMLEHPVNVCISNDAGLGQSAGNHRESVGSSEAICGSPRFVDDDFVQLNGKQPLRAKN